MNQPTEDRIKRLEEGQKRLEEEMRQLREQRTEEIKAVRVEVVSEDVINRFKALEEGQQEIKEDTNVLKIQMEGTRGDVLQIRESQADLRDKLIEHGQRLEGIEQKQEDHSELLGQLINIGEETKNTQAEHTKRFDKLEAIMMQILNRLPKVEGE